MDTHHVADMEDKWLYNVLKMLPERLKADHHAAVNALSVEMREDYHMSVKKAIGMYFTKSSKCWSRSWFRAQGPPWTVQSKWSRGSRKGRLCKVWSFASLLSPSIRKSTPTWQSAFEEAYLNVSENLFIVNPTVLAVLQSWEEFKETRLFEMDLFLSKGSAYELRSFKSLMLQRFDKSVERLMTRYNLILDYF